MAGRGVPGPMPGSIVTSGSGMSPALTRALAAQASYFPALSYGGVAQPSVGIPVLPPATGTSAFFQSGSHVHYAPIVHSAGGFGAAPPPPPLRAQSTSRAAVTGKGQGKAPTEPIDPAQEVNESEITETINLALEALEPPAYATPAATKAIFKHLSRIVTSQMKRKNPDVLLDFDSLENLYLWNLKFANFAGTRLGASLAQVGAKDIELEIRFGPEFPVRPPFVRVVSPRFVPPIAGGGGHITMGGAICFEALVLTEGPGGWWVTSRGHHSESEIPKTFYFLF